MTPCGLDPADAGWREQGVIPVLTIEDPAAAVPLARALAGAGLARIEVTLRTPAALESIRHIGAEVPEARVGAGTLRRPADLSAALAAGARFLVAPGATAELARAGRDCPVPFLPGCATASEAMVLAEAGYRVLKFFPAQACGGAAALRAWSAPLSELRFVPTGGIDAHNLAAYLALPCVLAVGGSWMVRPEWVASGDFARIAREAASAREQARNARAPG